MIGIIGGAAFVAADASSSLPDFVDLTLEALAESPAAAPWVVFCEPGCAATLDTSSPASAVAASLVASVAGAWEDGAVALASIVGAGGLKGGDAFKPPA